MALDDDAIDALRSSYRLLARDSRDATRLTDAFYQRLFEIAPEVRPMFRTDFEAQSIHDISPGVETMLREAENLRLLRAALRRIPVSLQVALELHYWERLSSSEIAEVLGIPSSTVRTHLGRARTMLEEALRKEAAAPEVVESTISDLDAWAEKLRGKVAQAAAGS